MTLQHLFYLSPIKFIAAIFIFAAFIAIISLAAKSLFGAGDVEGRNRGGKDRGKSDDLLDTPLEVKNYNATTAATIQRLKAENYELRGELKKRDEEIRQKVAECERMGQVILGLRRERVVLRTVNRKMETELERVEKEMERMRAELEREKLKAGQKSGQRKDYQEKEAAQP